MFENMKGVVRREADTRALLAEQEPRNEIQQLGDADALDIARSTNLNTDKQRDILQKLVNDMKALGLTINEIKVYLCLGIHGGLTGSEMSRKTGIQRTESYTYLSQLMTKGLVHASFDRPTKYYAAPIQDGFKSLSRVIETMIDGIGTRMPTYLTTITQLAAKIKADEEPGHSSYGTGGLHVEREIYQHLSGIKFIISKMHSMFASAKAGIEIVLTPKMLSAIWYQDMDFLNSLYQLKVPVNIIAWATPELKQEVMDETDKIQFVETPPTNSYVIIDENEVLTILESEKVVAIWTTNKAMIDIIMAANKMVRPAVSIRR